MKLNPEFTRAKEMKMKVIELLTAEGAGVDHVLYLSHSFVLDAIMSILMAEGQDKANDAIESYIQNITADYKDRKSEKWTRH